MVTGSLSLGGSGSVYPHSSTSTQSQQDDMKQSITSSAKYQTDRDERPNKSSIEKSSSLFTMPSRKEGRKSSSDGGNLPISMSLSSHHNEPQITPSISNIGGAVLRSKTADFERLLIQSKKSNSGSASSSVASESGVQAQTADTTEAAASSQVKKQPIYKRKELISSVQSSKK